jgi:hypothetical protein
MDQYQQELIRILQEIRDNQNRQLEMQKRALEMQTEQFELFRQQAVKAQELQERAERLQGKRTQAVRGCGADYCGADYLSDLVADQIRENSAFAESNTTLGQVIRGHFYRHGITGQDTNIVLAHFA